MIVQKLKKEFNDEFELAVSYFSIISSVNSLGLTSGEIDLLAFTAVKGNISTVNVKNEFCKKKNTSIATIGNIVSKLKKLKLVVKTDGKVKVNPVFNLNFNENIVLQIVLLKK